MKLKPLNKFILGAIFGSMMTISIYATADNDDTSITNSTVTKGTIPYKEVNNFAKVYAITKAYYVESVTDEKLMKGAIDGMLTNLDPHSNYLDETDFKQLSEMTNGEFAGLGIELTREKTDGGGIKVVAPIYGTPAYRAGIKSGDTIIKINGEPTSDLSLDEAIKKMRGKPKTNVTITIARANELKPIDFTITRDIIVIKSVQYTMLDNKNYAYIKVSNFQADTTNELASAMIAVYKENPQLKGVILDLRDDPGGILQSAVGVAGAFLPANSLVVYTDGRLETAKHKYYAKKDDYDVDGSQERVVNKIPSVFKTLPMVVLINQGTASASEIVSGALQDHKRAKIVGTRSFGKGSVQTVIPLSEKTAVKLTTALYFTPNGRSIQAKGIAPDIIIQSEYNDILASYDISEASYGKHIDNPNKKDASSAKSASVPVIRPEKQITNKTEIDAKYKKRMAKQPKVFNQEQANVDLSDDFQLQWALNIIQGKPLPKTATASKPVASK